MYISPSKAFSIAFSWASALWIPPLEALPAASDGDSLATRRRKMDNSSINCFLVLDASFMMLTPDRRVSMQNGTLLFLFSIRLMNMEIILTGMMR
jgi:hypothetical protein